MRSKKRLSDSRRYFVEGMNIREHSQNTKQKKAEELEKLAEECLAPQKKGLEIRRENVLFPSDKEERERKLLGCDPFKQ